MKTIFRYILSALLVYLLGFSVLENPFRFMFITLTFILLQEIVMYEVKDYIDEINGPRYK